MDVSYGRQHPILSGGFEGFQVGDAVGRQAVIESAVIVIGACAEYIREQIVIAWDPMVTIRKAAVTDSARIAGIHVDTWRDTYAGLLPDRVLLGMSRRRHRATWSVEIEHHRNGHAVIVAEDGDAGVVGFGSCGRARYVNLPYDGEVHTLYVLPDYQGQGIGKKLLGGLFAELLARELRSALVWVLADNPARFFYQAMGGAWIAEREERLWGLTLREMAFAWNNLEHAVTAAAERLE